MASTLGDLAKVCAKLEQIYREDVVGNPKRGGWEAGAIETIRKLAEVVVHGEAESEVCFELFTEKCMMGLLVPRLAWRCRSRSSRLFPFCCRT
ncbi:hypothetical protein M885DRAFT_204973 [Pelagophyceae sp. CCMP2097]|nr:hypothetical protein M885DRAFT_204973 [Pelagophyceae sp. CCMP2097]